MHPVTPREAPDPFRRGGAFAPPSIPTLTLGDRGPRAPVGPEPELERAAPAVEVTVRWGDEGLLHVAHVEPGGRFVVGIEGAVDFVADVGGTEGPLAWLTYDGDQPCVRVPEGATAIVADGDTPIDGLAVTRAGADGSPCIDLVEGRRARVVIGPISLEARRVHAGRRIGATLSVDRRPLLYIGGSILLHTLLLGIFAMMPPAASAISATDVDVEHRLVAFVRTATEIEPVEAPVERSQEHGSTAGQAHAGASGEMGRPDSPRTRNRHAVPGEARPEDVQLARDPGEIVRSAGALGVLARFQDAFTGPTSPFGADRAIGADAMAALGALMGDQLGDNRGVFGGLGPIGTGRGGDREGRGTIGTGPLGTRGGPGYGDGPGLDGRRRGGVPGEIRPCHNASCGATLTGSLSAEAIRRVVVRHLPEVRFCYEQGLQQRPDLEGRVVTRFMINGTGAVQLAVVTSSDVHDARVEGCMTDAIRRWTFPQPEDGGVVTVTYPFVMTSP